MSFPENDNCLTWLGQFWREHFEIAARIMEIHGLHVKVGDSFLLSFFEKHGVEFGATVHRLLHKLHHVLLIHLRNFVLQSLVFHLLLLLLLQDFDILLVPDEK